MATTDAATPASSSTSLVRARDMQRELEEWRQQRSAMQARTKKTMVMQKKTRRAARALPLQCRTNVEGLQTAAQERDMRRELERWKEAKAARQGKENSPSQIDAVKVLRIPQSRPFLETSPVSSLHLRGDTGSPCNAVAEALAAMETHEMSAPPPSPTAASSNGVHLGQQNVYSHALCSSAGLCVTTAMQPHALHAGVVAAFAEACYVHCDLCDALCTCLHLPSSQLRLKRSCSQ